MHDNLRAIEAEKSVLGAIILDGLTAMDRAIRLRPEHFALSSHREIFVVCGALLQKHNVIDLVAVRGALGERIDSVGGMAYLSGLSDGVFRNFDMTQRVDAILEAWKLRTGSEICSRYGAQFASGEDSALTLAALQSEVIDTIQESAEQDDPLVASWADAELQRLLAEAHAETSMGYSYGCRQLNAWTNGMRPGEVTVVGARSGIGKSALMKQATVANCRVGNGVDLFSLEMTRTQIIRGLVAIISQVEYRKLIRPNLMRAKERIAVEVAFNEIKDWPLRVYDRSDIHIDQICALARMGVRRSGTKLVCVDYAQSVEADGKDERLKVASVSRKLTKLSKAEGNHLLLLSQLRKVSHEQSSSPPTVADLRETGQLENDAHVVVLLHRGWDSDHGRISNSSSLIIPKCRDGVTGVLESTFNPANLCFE